MHAHYNDKVQSFPANMFATSLGFTSRPYVEAAARERVPSGRLLMPLQPYVHYAEIGSRSAYERWNPRMKFFVGVLALIGIGVALAVAREIQYPVLGAFVGGVLGYGSFASSSM